MLASVNCDLTGCQQQPSPDHAVWGDVRRPTAASILRQGLRLVPRHLCGVRPGHGRLQTIRTTCSSCCGNGNVEVIVQFNHIPTNADIEPVRRKPDHTPLPAHQGCPPAACRRPRSGRSNLNPVVTYISPNRAVSGSLDITTQTVGANVAWQSGWTGTGIGVAVIDSGIYAHDDLDGLQWQRLPHRLQPELRDRADRHRSLRPRHARGRHHRRPTARIPPVPGFTRTFNGMAPNVNLINLQVLDQNGAGTDSNVIAAIDRGHQPAEHIQHPGDQSVAGPAGLRKLHGRSPVPGRGSRLELRHRGGGGGGQFRTQRRGQPASLWHHRFAGKRSLCDHRGRHQHARLDQCGRRHRSPATARMAHRHRSYRQARPGGARQQHRFADGSEQYHCHYLSVHSDRQLLLRSRAIRPAPPPSISA